MSHFDELIITNIKNAKIYNSLKVKSYDNKQIQIILQFYHFYFSNISQGILHDFI